jgi:type I restriction enzyme, R subunit
MATQTKEQMFEATVSSMLGQSGWRTGNLAEWDAQMALFPERVLAFIRDTQPTEWSALEALHSVNTAPMLIDGLVQELEIKGTLAVLRHGFRFYGKTFRVAYFKPASGLNPEALARFERNELTVTRQVPCHATRHDTLDMLYALNGLPVATCELKNPWTGQSWRHAVRQYQTDRDPNAPLFRFKTGTASSAGVGPTRALVHFAADPDEVQMTTRIAADATRFLPFNRGSAPGEVHCGAGNPPHESGYRTGYFWVEVLERERFLDILANYMFIERTEEKVEDAQGARTVRRDTMIFPRYHQLEAVHRLVAQTRSEGAGHHYLIQHSAGSGKTNSISWLAHRLASLHTAADDKVFDCVVVITDRQVLDQQLQDAVYQIEHAQGVVKPIDQDSRQLAEALVDGTKIVITTLQKFPFVMRGLLRVAGADSSEDASEQERRQAAEWRKAIAGRKYAVIVDEAHSSQTGEAANELRRVLGVRAQGDLDDDASWEDGLNAMVERHGRQENLSFFAFTATPKGKTLELFGRHGASGKPEPFHVYSMRQAIEEGFILDVLRHYTTYKTYYRLLKAADDDPELPKRKAGAALARFMSLHPHNIEQKTEVIIEHFREQVRHRISGRAKAMVVTSSRLHAKRYMEAFKRYIADHGYTDVRPLVAFSGTVVDPDTGEEFTEPGMNIDPVTGRSISEAALPGRFASSDFNVLLVANKYQTGFDQPLLHTMYVDKRLDGVQAVQTLSRLNRTAAGKDEPFVLDFVNDSEDILTAFKPYYDRTELLEESDHGQLAKLKHELDQTQVYYWNEVEAFAEVFYKPVAKQGPADHAAMQSELQETRERFNALDPDDQTAFRDRLSAFVRLYAFLSQIIPYRDVELEMLASFGKLLLPHLHPGGEDEPLQLGDDVTIQYYRLQRIGSAPMKLGEGPTEYVVVPTEVGTGRPEEPKAPLSEIITLLNERFGTEFNEEDRLFFAQIRERAVNNEHIRETARANPLDKFELSIRKAIESLMIERMGENDALVTRYMNDPEFQETAFRPLAREIFNSVREGEGSAEPAATPR